MAQATEEVRTETAEADQRIINVVVIKVATPNGSGSQSANLILMRAIFGLGVPVSGKNLFASNIQGLPTWYTIRANDKGWLAQRRRTDLFIAMNPESIVEDVASLDPGSTLIVRKRLAHFVQRDDIKVYAVPFTDLAAQACEDTRLRNKVINVIYVGVAAYLLGMDMDAVTLEKAVELVDAKNAKAGNGTSAKKTTKKAAAKKTTAKKAANG